ncbi:MAG: DNA-binding protein [Clostridia bacterium]|nr:DNA-binding protein [Clostridia bacterium]
MQKDLNYSELFNEYKTLLTENQAEIFELYYFCDLSLSEISEMKGISRQGVSDAISKTREALQIYEGKLKLLQKKRNLVSAVENLTFDGKNELLNLIGDI